MTKLRETIKKARQKLNIDRKIGYLGDGSGEVRDRDNPGRYFVRLPQGVDTLGPPVSLPLDVNANLPTTDGLAVEIGLRKGRPIILGASYDGLEAAGVNPLQLNPIDDQATKFVNQSQITTFYATRHADSTNKPFYAVVFPGFFRVGSTLTYFAGSEVNLASFVPASPDHCYAVVLIKTDGTLEAFASTAINASDPLTTSDIQEALNSATAGSIPVWAFELKHDDTLLTVDKARQADIRMPFGGRTLTASDVPAHAHSIHTGLTTGDDHTQYALLAGRAGGQTLIGGTGSGDSLTLNSTSHATKGSVILAGSLLTLSEASQAAALGRAVVTTNRLTIQGSSTVGATVFTGAGLNDATSGGTYNGQANATFTIIIDSTGATDTFKWKKDSGTFVTGVAITGAAQNLSDGATVTFGATTGHTLNDQWTIATTVVNALQVYSPSGSVVFAFGNNGSIGIPSLSGGVMINVNATQSGLNSSIIGANITLTRATTYDESTFTHALFQGTFSMSVGSGKTLSGLLGLFTAVTVAATHAGTIANLRLVRPFLTIASGAAGAITAFAGFNPGYIWNTNTVAITNFYGINVPSVASGSVGGATITNLYGIYVDNQTAGGTLNYAIYTNSGPVRLGDAASIIGSVAASVQLLVKGAASQSGNMLNIQDSSANLILQVLAPNTINPYLQIADKRTLGAGVSDGYTSGLRLTPQYDAAFTVTRHNYLDLADPVLTNSAAVTDAAVMRFNANAGTHKAVDGGTTKTTPGGVDAWPKININGTIYYIPAYTSKTA